jgi:hypothetical protein
LLQKSNATADERRCTPIGAKQVSQISGTTKFETRILDPAIQRLSADPYFMVFIGVHRRSQIALTQ